MPKNDPSQGRRVNYEVKIQFILCTSVRFMIYELSHLSAHVSYHLD